MPEPVFRCLLIVFAAVVAQACVGDEAAAPRVHVDVVRVAKTGQVQPVGGITSAGQPDARALQAFADAGYVAVIDLRGPEEDRGLEDEAAAVADLGLDYVTLPIVGEEAISFDNAKRLDALLAQYDQPVLVHCKSGNRVGALLALRESLAGADDDNALAYGRAAGMTRLEGVVKQRLEAD